MKKIVNARVLPYGEDEVENVSREVLPEAYYRDGSIYAMKAELPMKSNTFFGTDVRAVLNNRDWFINIDEERDWIMAEVLMGELQKKINA
jgi:CMP-N-acetylneuraminic acid synthetase